MMRVYTSKSLWITKFVFDAVHTSDVRIHFYNMYNSWCTACKHTKKHKCNTQALAAGPKRLGTARVAGGTQVLSPLSPLFLE